MSTQHILVIMVPTIIIMAIVYLVRRNLGRRHKWGKKIKGRVEMSYIVDFNNVSTVGLESSRAAKVLAGLRANEARYFMNKYKHEFTVVPANESQDTIDCVNRILKKERDIEFAAKPLETSRFQVENIKFAYVFYEDGLVVNVMYTVDDSKSGPLVLSFLREWKYQRS